MDVMITGKLQINYIAILYNNTTVHISRRIIYYNFLYREKRALMKNEVLLRKKTLNNNNFPNQELIEEFLVRKDCIPTKLDVEWKQPQVNQFVVSLFIYMKMLYIILLLLCIFHYIYFTTFYYIIYLFYYIFFYYYTFFTIYFFYYIYSKKFNLIIYM